MLITDKNELERFYSYHRLWQGIPGIERTKGGRTFLTLYSGGVSEQRGNFALVLKSDTDTDFGEPIAAAFKDGNFRCFDSLLWIDPIGRLWFIWNVSPGEECWGAICDDPDAENLVWGKEFYIGRGVMLNKPTVLSSGEWLFPIALWKFDIRSWLRAAYIKVGEVARSNVYKTVDNGKTFVLIGGSDIKERNFDEHSIVELDGGILMMTVRCDYGTGKCYSYDGGKTWSRGENSGFGPTVSRIHIRRLKSGRILRISHNGAGRRNLTAYLSEDNGNTYPYSLLLDERNNVSYPDATEGCDGYIYVAYDRERGNNMGSIEKAYACAREILTAKITENDIIAGEIKSDGSFVKNAVSKLEKLKEGDPNPYLEYLLSPKELAEDILRSGADAIKQVFACHPVNSAAYKKEDGRKLDSLISRFKENGSCEVDLLAEIISTLRVYPKAAESTAPIIDAARALIDGMLHEDFSVSDIAQRLNISVFYLTHVFKEQTPR